MDDSARTDTPAVRAGRFGKLRNLFRRRKSKRTDQEVQALSLPQMTRGMQAFSLILFLLSTVAITAFVLKNPLGLSFLPQPSTGQAAAVASASVDEPVQLYQCPMHIEVIEQQPGNCPICEMKLMPMKQGTPDAILSEANLAGIGWKTLNHYRYVFVVGCF